VLNTEGKVIGIVSSKARSAEAVGFCIPVEDLISAMNELPSQVPQQVARLERHHNIRVIYLKMLVAGALYHQSCLDSYFDSMDKAIRRGGTVDEGVNEIAKACVAQTGSVRGNLESQVLPELSSIVRDENTTGDVRRDLQELWATCSDMESYVSRPRGSFVTYREKARELKDRFDHLVESLRLSVGLSD
jgi:S1-C subfamily serine protease